MYNQNPYFNMMYQPPAQRLQQYEQFQDPARNLVKCRAVTSIDEAKAAMIDLDGSMTIFTDLGHGKIYTKQINLDGTATLNSYALEAQNGTETSETRFETRFAGIENDIKMLREEIEDVKSSAADANNRTTKKNTKSNAVDAANV